MKAGNNMSRTRFADFVMCVKPTELGQVHTKQEGIYTHADTHIAHLHTHTHRAVHSHNGKVCPV